jgi:predicted DNA repair protein MutK
MPSGLAALLDDVAGIAKLAAASVDDVTGAAGKAGAKAVGVVVDDTAVTPGYAVGFTPDRELPIIAKIAVGSLRNKLLFLLPGALLLSAFAPWGVTPLLMLGGAYLCFEATEKTLETLGHRVHQDEGAADPEELALSSIELERRKVNGAVRTDLILSAEIMAIALADVADRPLGVQAVALALVGIAITAIVYGVVAFIVKMDDIGLHMAQRRSRSAQAVGRALVRAMPTLLDGLTAVGTAAMLWVGGGIIVHGLEHFHAPILPGLVEALEHWASSAPVVGAFAGWLAFALASAVVGLVVGAAVIVALALVRRLRRPRRSTAAIEG